MGEATTSRTPIGTSADPPSTLAPMSAMRDHVHDQLQRGRPLITLALAFIVGTAVGAWWPWRAAWLIVGGASLAAMLVLLWRGRRQVVVRLGMLAVVPLGAAWSAQSTAYLSEDHLLRYLPAEPALSEVTGTVASEPYLRTPARGAFGPFSYAGPATLFELSVDSIVHDGETVPASGKLLVRIDAADHRLQPGQRIRAKGWLAPIEAPRNPGELNYKAILADKGVYGRLTMRTRGNWSLLSEPHWAASWRTPIDGTRRFVADEARDALRLGMLDVADNQAQRTQRRRLALLEALLLGQWTGEAGDIHESFRQVGLAHLMAISGAHLGILMGLVWMLVRLFVSRPPRAAIVLLVVLALYLTAVPWRLPIVRAALMAVLFLIGYASGRRISAMGMLALAAVVVLLWRPNDLFSAGFQLSFGVVAGLLLFARPLAHWLWPPPLDGVPEATWQRQLSRRVVDYLAVSIVAFLIALPLVAHHFALVNPLAVLLSVMALPVVTALLGLGYAKILLGVVLPSASMLVGGPLAWITDTMLSLVAHARHWPLAAIELARPPSSAWVIAMLSVAVACLYGCFARRGWALAACIALLLAWTFAIQRPQTLATLAGTAERPAMRINALSVGDGSCYLVRSGGKTLMFDCGSQAYMDVGEKSVVPALRRLGVRRIDVLFLSHADLDHYCGALAVVDAVSVGEVRVPPQLLRAARRAPDSAVAHLVTELRKRGVRIESTTRGWSRTWGETQLDVLWPTPDFEAERIGEDVWRMNDTSLVLSVRAHGRRLLLTGDIDDRAIEELIHRDADMNAEIAELPHHGSFGEQSSGWLNAVSPRIVLESTGPPRSPRDPWRALLRRHDVDRLVTDELGMIELTVPRDGPIRWKGFRAEMNRR